VLPSGFQSPEEISERQPMLFVIPDCWPPSILNNRGEHYDHAIARLKPGARLAKAYPKTNGKIAPGVVPLGADMVRCIRTAMLVLLGAVGLVLLIACANVANLLLATLRRAQPRDRHPAGADARSVDARPAGLDRPEGYSAPGCRGAELAGAGLHHDACLDHRIPVRDDSAWQVSGIRPNLALKAGERSAGGSAVLRCAGH
jgi:hypothetical protein